MGEAYDAVLQAFPSATIGHEAMLTGQYARELLGEVAAAMMKPHVLLKADLKILEDGKWICWHGIGRDLYATGKTPAEAAHNFDELWRTGMRVPT